MAILPLRLRIAYLDEQFLDFLVHCCQIILESITKASNSLTKNTPPRHNSNNKQKTSCNASVNVKCYCCQGRHFIYQCKTISSYVDSQTNIGRVRARSLNCLRSTVHTASKYPLGTCKTCFHKHNSLLHIPTLPNQPKIGRIIGDSYPWVSHYKCLWYCGCSRLKYN